MLYFVSVILLRQQGGLLVAFLESIYNKSFLFTMYRSLLKVIWTVLQLLLGPKLKETSIQIASNRFPIIFVLRGLRDLPGNFHILLLCTLKLFLQFLKKALKCIRNYLHLTFELKHLFIIPLSFLGLLLWFFKDKEKIKNKKHNPCNDFHF